MNRYHILLVACRHLRRFVLAGVLLTAVAAPAVVPMPEAVEVAKVDGVTPRNVVFILSDDHRFDAMSFMGRPFARTPEMDGMAEMGGMEIPLNAPRGHSQNKRFAPRDGHRAAGFPRPFVLEKPVHRNAQ